MAKREGERKEGECTYSALRVRAGVPTTTYIRRLTLLFCLILFSLECKIYVYGMDIYSRLATGSSDHYNFLRIIKKTRQFLLVWYILVKGSQRDQLHCHLLTNDVQRPTRLPLFIITATESFQPLDPVFPSSLLCKHACLLVCATTSLYSLSLFFPSSSSSSYHYCSAFLPATLTHTPL